jgi:hypothetical protein
MGYLESDIKTIELNEETREYHFCSDEGEPLISGKFMDYKIKDGMLIIIGAYEGSATYYIPMNKYMHVTVHYEPFELPKDTKLNIGFDSKRAEA